MWSSAPPRTGRPVVAATTDGAVRRAGPGPEMTISLKPAVERRRISSTTAWPAGVAMNAWPSCTAQGRRCRFPSAGSTGLGSLGNSVSAVASTPGSPARASGAQSSVTSTTNEAPAESTSSARSSVGAAPVAASFTVTGGSTPGTAVLASSSSSAPCRRTMRSAARPVS